MRYLRTGLGGVLSAGLALGSQGQLQVSESFAIGAGQYTANQALFNQGGTEEIGFSGSWGGSSTVQYIADTVTMQADGLFGESGGKAKFLPVGSGFETHRSVARSLSGVSNAPAYYVSQIVSAGVPAQSRDAEGYAFAGLGNATVSENAINGVGFNLGGVYVGFVDDAGTPNEVSLALRSREAVSGVNDRVIQTAASNRIWHVVLKIEANVSGSQDRVTYWLNPTDMGSDALMTATAAATDSYFGFALQSGGDFLRLTTATDSFDRTFFFDEVRLATDLASIVPEPVTGLLLAGVGLAAMGRRARRRTA
jgi:hypothetical protein